MFLMNYLLSLVLVFVVLGVMVLGVIEVPYYGVVALMWISFFCCVLMVILGRTFSALVMYIVYLGGLIVVFGYCVSVEKDNVGVVKSGWLECFVMFMVVSFVVLMWGLLVGQFDGMLVYIGWEDLVCLETNGVAGFYSSGGAGLVVCSWGLLVVLFSILIILGWTRLGGFRPF